MKGAYDDVIIEASRILAEAIVNREDDLVDRAAELDGDVKRLLWQLGSTVMGLLFSVVSGHVVDEVRQRGLTVDEKHRIGVGTVFGRVEMDSPYMRNKATKETARPVFERLGLRDGSRTLAVERALTDFGAEESFALAAVRFAEHYHHEVGRTSVLRLVERCATEAEAYVEQRLEDARALYDEPIATRPGQAEMLIELDGCEIRTGTLEAAQEAGLSTVRQLPKRARVEAWREVRVGFARGLHEVDRTYVAQMAKYPEVVGQLFSAAVERGLSSETEVVAVADGGNGLREELEVQFPGLFFVLDHPHLCQHLYDTASEIGLCDGERHRWVADCLDVIEPGGVNTLIDRLSKHAGPGKARVERLCGYLDRFSDGLDYDTAEECGWPLGSGEIESAHRYIPQKRLKIPGACWHPDTINPMLALRVLRANGWWEDFWQQKAQARRAA